MSNSYAFTAQVSPSLVFPKLPKITRSVGVGPKWPNITFFGNFQQKNTVSEINDKVPLFLELEFLISSVKKIMWYSSLVNSSTMQHNTRVYQARVPFKKKKNYTVLQFGKLEYCVIFFFWDNQQINIKIKISSFFYVFIYLNRSIVKYRDFNFKI